MFVDDCHNSQIYPYGRVCRSVIISVSININHFTPNIFNFNERKMPSQRSTAELITQQLINNKHHKREFKLPLIISFDIHSIAVVILLWNSFWHLHRQLHGMRVFIYSPFVCTFLDFYFPFFQPSWMMDLVRLPKLARSPSRHEAHIRKWRKICVTSRIANDREKQRQYLHITAISVLFGCHLHVVCL